MIVYVFKNSATGKAYVGQTKNLAARLSEHRYCAGHNGQTPFYKSIRKHGWDAFALVLTVKVPNVWMADEIETSLISRFGSTDRSRGYNLDLGGTKAGKHSSQTKKKIGKISRTHKHTEETKQRMSISRRGVPKPSGFGKKIRAARLGTKHSESTRANLRAAWVRAKAEGRRTVTLEQRKKISESLKKFRSKLLTSE